MKTKNLNLNKNEKIVEETNELIITKKNGGYHFYQKENAKNIIGDVCVEYNDDFVIISYEVGNTEKLIKIQKNGEN